MDLAFRDSLIDMIHRADRGGAAALLEGWGAAHGYERLVGEVLEPTLLRVGEEWREAETFSLAQAYVAAKIAEDAMLRVAERRGAGLPPAPRGQAVIGNIEDDFHALGRKIVGVFLRTEGWEVTDLGNDVPAAAFVDAALERGARVIGASAMMLSTARNIARLRAEIDGRGLAGRLQLAVGGAVFLVVPGLAAEVGGDGTAPNALAAARLFAELAARAEAAGPLDGSHD